MTHLTVREHGRISRVELGRAAARLQAFDERLAGRTGETVFDWGYRQHVRARSYVGVIQIPGLVVEILPKIDRPDGGDVDERRAQGNLLYMLSVARKVPVTVRDVASLSKQRQSVLDALVAAFAERLLCEFRRGLPHGYVRVEGNHRFFKGRLLVAEHMRANVAHRERAYVAFDEFQSDVPLNRVLKATCRTLARRTRAAWTERCLREALLLLADVEEVALDDHHFEAVHLDRGSERFSDLLEFCRLVHEGLSPTPSAGDTASFSLLFPMEKLYEEFIGEFIRRHPRPLGLAECRVHLQSAGATRWLLRRDGRACFRLKPDVLVQEPDGSTRLVLDTKWKRLTSDDEDSRNGVSGADVYQLHAYLSRFACSDAVLLYPIVPGATAKTYHVEGHDDRRIRVEFVDLSGDLAREPGKLVLDLTRALRPPEFQGAGS